MDTYNTGTSWSDTDVDYPLTDPNILGREGFWGQGGQETNEVLREDGATHAGVEWGMLDMAV